MVLVFLTNSWKVANNLDVQLLEELGITDTRALEDLRSTKCTGAQNNVFPRAHDSFFHFALVTTVLRVDIGNSDGLVSFEDDA